ncbi:MAG: hypothetical protein BV459_05540 [Thermoplasmata archaeon M11B2D]|nr:MAG: hypothetical protein BV459_05540 [Thermoplasmata archaeon M11B2D]
MKRKKERDGMQSEQESGRNASNPRLACPPYPRSIIYGKVVHVYISLAEVSEIIRWLCLKKK